MEPVQQPQVAVGYTQLDLGRPSSYSVAGRVADTSIQATKYPQTMLYSAGRGLVTYEPPHQSGPHNRQWLNALSSPKTIAPKSPKAPVWCSHSHTHVASQHAKAQKQQQQQQQQQQLTTSRFNSSSPCPADLSSHDQQLELLGNDDGTISAAYPAGEGETQQQQQQQQAHNDFLGAESAVCVGSTGTFRRPSSAGRLHVHGSWPAEEAAAFRSGHSTNGTSSTQGNSISSSCDASSNLGSKMNPCSKASKATAGQRQVPWNSKRMAACDAKGRVAKGNAIQQEQACKINTHAGGVQLDHGHRPHNGSVSSPASERLTLTAPLMFTWGGRVKQKHSGLCRMLTENECHPTTHTRMADDCPMFYDFGPGPAGSSVGGVSPGTKQPAAAVGRTAARDAAVSQAAAEIGVQADKLMKMLQRKVQRNSSSRQLVAGHRSPFIRRGGGVGGHLAGVQLVDADIAMADDPIGVSQDYLRL